MEIKVELPSDADIHAVVAAVPGAVMGRGWDRDAGAWYIEAPAADAVAAAAAAYDHVGYRLAEAKRLALNELADRRWRAETAGITVAGLAVSTSRESQAMIAAAAFLAQPVRFKTAAGEWVELTAEGMADLARAVGAHVQACFDAEHQAAAAIAAATSAEAIAAVVAAFSV